MNDLLILDLLQYGFIQKAFLAGSLTALACASLGIFLVLRKMSLIGDGLSHASFGAIALGLFLGLQPMLVAIPLVLVASILILKISEKTKLYGDSAIGMISVAGIALGIILTSLASGFNVDLFSYLFGNILAIKNSEVWLATALSIIILTLTYLFYWDLFTSTFDQEYATATGIKTNLINYLLVSLTSVTIILSIKVVGVMLVSALIIFPAVTALQLSHQFKRAVLLSGLIAVFSVVVGIIISFLLNLPSGATIVMLSAVLFLLALIYNKIINS